jgi:hypothetical protein
MYNNLLSILLFIFFAFSATAQKLPVKTATMFKNGKTMLIKSGTVSTENGKHTLLNLPNALFGTYWASSPTGDLMSVFCGKDSLVIEEKREERVASMLDYSKGKKAKITLKPLTPSSQSVVLDGVVEDFTDLYNGKDGVVFHTSDGRWLTFLTDQLLQIELYERPDLTPKITKSIEKEAITKLEINFKTLNKKEQPLELAYLTDQLGWLPVYQLELNEKGKSKLSLRAEIANDAEDISHADLRLAVGIPNFSYADGLNWLMNFDNPFSLTSIYTKNNDANYYTNAISHNQSLSSEYLPRDENYKGTEGDKAEDFFFYTVKAGHFPKYSRYQLPVFESEVEPAHFYECKLKPAGPPFMSTYYDQRSSQKEQINPVSHYIEFKNASNLPWTTGVVNMHANQNGTLFPISQDKLNYTPSGVNCKVRMAQTPEIKVTHNEGDIERKENSRRFFNRDYNEVIVEGEICVANYKDKTIKMKVLRDIEGELVSSQKTWTNKQEQATLRVNPSYQVSWEMELKPGEEQKWKYQYKVYVNM